ncbi:DNA-binding response regulator, OmpR family, contains REC and winged-helix (wHTH) domain [Pedococcus cremeus]|uniref:DNA-binding response regulator, OmpR family, contains REC and winged-helix (WHTH) domain n=1 Tax=Pedococcus cremeus TaxID=587636 RepID=A0A1H9UQX7_9MICO|nr:response regulator transcription factor [Pedococcus cremeus]SES11731.1 DNA-binding response regulator, OmpR family, contains REC and winged-helix (wHTH) domain [Pedococcus cremeus]
MTAQRVLVVDDEPGIRKVLRAYLEREGFAVDEAADGPSALTRFEDGAPAPDLVLLDIGLPGVDGLEVLRRLRTTSDAYVLLVTARADEVDRLVGLGVGADDYITKPFSPREVVARVRAVLRRPRGGSAPADSGTVVFEGLSIDENRREVVLDGHEVALSALEFDLLLLLARHPRRVFSREQILEQVWGTNWVGDDRVVDVHIRSLRHRLGDDASRPTWIGTVRGVGYRFLGGSR